MFGVIYGTAETDRYGFLFKRLRSNIEMGKKSFVLVPEQFSVSTERQMIEILGSSAQRLVEILTFSRLGNEVLNMLGPLRMNYIDGAGREILARRVLQEIEGELTYLNRNVHRKGFSSNLVELVSEFKRYGVTPDALEAAAGNTGKATLDSKLSDLAKFCRAYTKMIEEKNSDAEDNLALALERFDRFEIPHGAELLITEFKSFTPLELEVIVKFMQKTADTRLILCCDDVSSPSDIFVSAAAAYRDLKVGAEECGIRVISPERLERSDKFSDRQDLVHLWREFFEVNPKKYGAEPRHIHIFSPLGYYAEVQKCAEIIRRLIRTRGYRQNDFLILARDCDKYDRIMPLIFKKYGLNIFVDSKRSIMQNPFVQTLASVLEILAYGFSYERAAVIIKNGFFGGLSQRDADIFDNYLLEASPSYAMWNDEGEWKFNPDEREYDMAEINRIKDAVLTPVHTLKSKIHGRKTVGEIVTAVFECLSECCCEAAMQERCCEYSEGGMVYLAEEYRRVWNSVISILSRFDEMMGDENITYEKFYEIFDSACKCTKIGISPQTLDEVTFSNIDLFRSANAKVVFVLGVNYGVFPKGYGTEGLISDSEREILRERGIRLAMTALEKSDDEQNLIYRVLSAAADELYLMTPCIDNSGKTLEPSKIITKIRDELFDSKYFVSECGGTIFDKESAEVVFDELKRICARKGLDELSADEQAALSYFLEDDTAAAELKNYLERIKLAKEGCSELSKAAALKLYGREIMLSASKLEKFNACAFSYFMRYGLLLKPRSAAEFDPMSMGNVLHAALEKYFSDKRNIDYSQITRADCESDVSEIVRGIASGSGQVMYGTSAYYKYLIMRIIGIASTTAWETVKFYQNSDFRPYGFEIEISDDGDVQPFIVDTPVGRARINGFIDRADSAVIDGVRYISIVDYKSSVRELDAELAADGVHFQPLVYANALRAGIDVRPAAMLYQQMNDPIINAEDLKKSSDIETEVHKKVKTLGWIVDESAVGEAFDRTHKFVSGKETHITSDEMLRRLDDASKKISETAEGIFSGRIEINPYKRRGFDACAFCDYKSICSESL